MYPSTWPIGTCRATDLPQVYREALSKYVSIHGTLSDAFEIHQSATEGPFILFGGYKIRVKVDEISPVEKRIKLV